MIIRLEKNGNKAAKEMYAFQSMESVNLGKHVRFIDEASSRDDEDIAALIRHEFMRSMASVPNSGSNSESDEYKDAEGDKTLWRLTVMPSTTVLFA